MEYEITTYELEAYPDGAPKLDLYFKDTIELPAGTTSVEAVTQMQAACAKEVKRRGDGYAVCVEGSFQLSDGTDVLVCLRHGFPDYSAGGYATPALSSVG